MNKKLFVYLVIGSLFVGVFTIGMIVQFGAKNTDPLILNTIDGEAINIQAREEDVILLYFFRLSCSTCKITDPLVAAIDMDYSESNLLIVTITIDPADSIIDLNSWRADLNVTWGIVKDDITNSYGSAFNIAFSPTTLIYDQNRNLAARFEGSGDFDTLVRITLDNLLNH